MSTAMRRPSSQRVDLVTLSENDLREIAYFIATRSGRGSETVETHLRWFLLGNPARKENDPVGFGLLAADQLVGCMLCVPQFFRYGSHIIRMMGSSSFYVDDRHRGQGGRLFLQYSRLANQEPLFGTSANSAAAGLWQAAGASPIPYSDGELFGVLRWPPIMEEIAHRKFSSRFLSRLAGGAISNLANALRPLKIETGSCDALRQLTSAEQANDLPIHDAANKLTAMRDLSYIRWRYFSESDRTVSVLAFRSRQPDREVLVTVNQRARGFRDQIETLNVLDVYPEVPAEEWLRILAALISRYRNSVDAVVLRSQSPDKREFFRGRGFRWRAFDAPTGWFIDKAHVLPSDDWYPVPADGDGLI